VRSNPSQPKVDWHTISVSNPDPTAFAAELKAALQEMTDAGYNITSQLVRGQALVIVGQRIVMPSNTPELFRSTSHGQQPALPPPPPLPAHRRRIVEPTNSVGTKEVLYHFLENGKSEQRVFPDILSALRLIQEQLGATDHVPDIVPISLVVASMTHFEPKNFPALLKTYRAELNDGPLE
jgi:hypothetical protein